MGPMLLALGVTVPLALGSGPSSVHAREHVLPERNDDRTARSTSWTRAAGWETSPAVQEGSKGSRVAAALSVSDTHDLVVQARGVALDGKGRCSTRAGSSPWTALETTYRGGELRVAVADLGDKFDCAQIRIRRQDDVRVGDLQWELVEPRYPNAGRASRTVSAPKPPVRALDERLEVIDVISREEWGARETQCTAQESDWYRMAIHHTAGPQTANDSVIERLQATQAFAMDSGTYCDLPYQMMVGFDGTLYEGRTLDLQSGATGGGNNPGNLAVCFIGCYHDIDPECVGEVGHDVTDEMMERGQLLVQTLVRMEDISTADDNIRGHQEWPGNATACPGNQLLPRLGELRADLTWFAGVELARSWEDTGIDLEVGGAEELWIEVENVGGLAWEPGETFLAPTGPRGDSPLYHSSWVSDDRVTTVDATTQPGEIGRFTFTVSVDADEDIVQTFGLVREDITWFADEPWGGGPLDEDIELTVRGIASEGATTGGEEETTGPMGTSGPDTDSDGSSLPPADGDDDGCGCTSSPRPSGMAALWLLALGLGLRRRR